MFEELTPEERKRAVEACEIIKTVGRASVSCLQRRMHLGYMQAARIMDRLEEYGIVGVPTPRRDYQRPIYHDRLAKALSANAAVEARRNAVASDGLLAGPNGGSK